MLLVYQATVKSTGFIRNRFLGKDDDLESCHPETPKKALLFRESAMTSLLVLSSLSRNLCFTLAQLLVQCIDPSIAALQRDELCKKVK